MSSAREFVYELCGMSVPKMVAAIESRDAEREKELRAELTTARAETAAMLEKAAGASCDNCAHGIPVEVDGPTVRHWYTAEAGKIIYVRCMAPAIRALIPISHAAALEKRLHDAELKGWQDCLRQVQGSIEGYPSHGGDITIMTALEKIVAERVLAESEVWNNNAGVKRLDDESEWAKMRLAANRAAAGAANRNPQKGG